MGERREGEKGGRWGGGVGGRDGGGWVERA